MTRPPLIQRPVYLSGADPSPAVVDACKKAAPFAGAVGTALLGAAAGYFAPKLFDWVGRRISGDQTDYDDTETVEIDAGPE